MNDLITQQNAMKDPAALRAAEEQLRAAGNASPTPQEIADQAGRTAMAEYGTGSDIQRAIQAATAAVKGAAGGNLSAALAGAQSGKVTVENNLLGGNEESQATWLRQHGIDMATCSDNCSCSRVKGSSLL